MTGEEQSVYRDEWNVEQSLGTPAAGMAGAWGIHRTTHWRWMNPKKEQKRGTTMRISEGVKQKVIALDERYRSSWDCRAMAHVVGIGHTTVAKILKEHRGPRPTLAEAPHVCRTRFIDRDVMWSSDFMDLPIRGSNHPKGEKRKLLKTLDETSRFRLSWDIVPSENALAVLHHADSLVHRMGCVPLVWKYDHGTGFTSELFQAFLEHHEIVPFPIAPRAPWMNGRVERDHQEIQRWLIPVWDKRLPDAPLDKEIDEGMLMLNYIKPRMVLGYETSAQVYFHKESPIEEGGRTYWLDQLQQIKDMLWPMSGERLQRKAVRMWLQKMGVYEEWIEIPKGAKAIQDVNRSSNKNVAF